MTHDLTSISKFLSYVLRHRPDAIGLTLDDNGWANVEELIRKAKGNGFSLTPELLAEVVRTNDKRRFAFSEDGLRLRASQGHSVQVELGLEALVPPEILFHGTASRFLRAIRHEGLKSMSRTHVHLSSDHETAAAVGGRHGKSVVLSISSGMMHREGIPFYLSANGVWLVERVSPLHILFPDEE